MTVTFNNRRQSDMPSLTDSDYYAFTVGTEVKIVSLPGAQPVGKIVCRYTSDEHNHPARPHKRYVVACGSGAKQSIADVSERELDRLIFEDMS